MRAIFVPHALRPFALTGMNPLRASQEMLRLARPNVGGAWCARTGGIGDSSGNTRHSNQRSPHRDFITRWRGSNEAAELSPGGVRMKLARAAALSVIFCWVWIAPSPAL